MDMSIFCGHRTNPGMNPTHSPDLRESVVLLLSRSSNLSAHPARTRSLRLGPPAAQSLPKAQRQCCPNPVDSQKSLSSKLHREAGVPVGPDHTPARRPHPPPPPPPHRAGCHLAPRAPGGLGEPGAPAGRRYREHLFLRPPLWSPTAQRWGSRRGGRAQQRQARQAPERLGERRGALPPGCWGRRAGGDGREGAACAPGARPL